ncbi:MAG TPA: S53 family peptidase [Solirubrobacteraceae bacterium]|nr:S53 family peptidase [Solirubrobacteraceae bacterium]
MADTHVVLSGSNRARKHDAQRVGDVDPASAVEVTVTVRGPDLPQVTPGKSMSREELERRYSAAPEDMDAVASELGQFGLEVLDRSGSVRSLRVRGTAAQMQDAFRADLGIYRHDGTEFRGREGSLEIPTRLAGIVTGVFGLDQRRVARRVPGIPPYQGSAEALAAGALSPADLEERYRFPPGEGEGQTVAIAEFGGAYFASDLETFCTQQGRPEPTVNQIGLGVPVLTEEQVMALPADQREQVLEEAGEVNMDVQIVAGLCPGSDIVVYFATWDQKGWVDLLGEVVKGVPAGPVAVSVSWGLSEDSTDFSAAARRVIDQQLQAAALLGITVCVSAGDDGSGDQVTDGQAHVNFPACSPHVLAVGGTQVDADQEVVWWQAPGSRSAGGGATGGGISRLFPQPSWQTVEVRPPDGSTATGRIVPDIAALAGPPYYQLVLLGKPSPNGGTSAAAPLWAALIARSAAAANPPRAPVFLAPVLYGAGPDGHPLGLSVCRDITAGNNTSTPPGWGFAAGPGFDAASGWGVPDGPPLVGSRMAPGAAAAQT